jgi:hypothetical protein
VHFTAPGFAGADFEKQSVGIREAGTQSAKWLMKNILNSVIAPFA